MSKPSESFLKGDSNSHQLQHQQQTPYVHLSPHLHHANSYMSKVGSREHTAQPGYSPHLQPPQSRAVSAGGSKVGGQSGKQPLLLPPIGTSLSPYNPRVVNFDSHPTWEDLQHTDMTCTTASAEGKAARGGSHSSVIHSKLNPLPPLHSDPASTGTRAAK